MIFLCFNLKNRTTVAENLLNHIINFGFDVWYDRKDIFLGDNRYEMNLENGANNKNIEYAVVIISPEFSSGNYCNKELDILWSRAKNNEIHIFPIFYDLTEESVPERYRYLMTNVSKFITYKDQFIYTAYHVVAKILYDHLGNFEYNTLKELYNKVEDKFIKVCLSTYEVIDRSNYNAKMSILYILYKYLKVNLDFTKIPNYYYFGFEKLYSFNKLNIKTDLRELQILEFMTIILLNIYAK